MGENKLPELEKNHFPVLINIHKSNSVTEMQNLNETWWARLYLAGVSRL